MKILAVCGSLQARSSNRDLLARMAELAPESIEVTVFDGIRDLPQFDPDQMEALIEPVNAWRTALTETDAVVIACPEYGHSFPGSLKNALDWVIMTGQLDGKVVAVTGSVKDDGKGRQGPAALCAVLEAVKATPVGPATILKGDGVDAALEKLLDEMIDALRPTAVG